jgi:transcriptional regulator with XRE-family HTH domain
MLKDLRQQKELNQTDLSKALGWSLSGTRVSDLEQGLSIPDEELTNRIATVFGVDDAMRADLLLAAGCVPSDRDVLDLRESLQKRLEQWPEPMYVVDFAWRLIAWNRRMLEVFGFDETRLLSRKPCWLELAFSPEWPVRERVKNWDESAEQLVQAFLVENWRRRSFGQRWMETLLLELRRFPDFAAFWDGAQTLGARKLISDRKLMRLCWTELRIRIPPKRTVEYRIVQREIEEDSRYRIVYYSPSVISFPR